MQIWAISASAFHRVYHVTYSRVDHVIGESSESAAMAFSALPKQLDVSSQILSKFDSVTFISLDSTVASSWRAELDESIRLTKVRCSVS